MKAMPREHRLEIILVALIVIVTAVSVRWAYIPSFPERHVAVSEEKYGYEVGDPGPWFSAWSLGDGQAYALIALDPSGKRLAEEIPEAGYRFARAGYGWAVWAVSIGQPDLVPYALGLVGALCLVGTLLLAIRLRSNLGHRTWILLLNPALYIGFAGDTSETMGILLLTLTLGWGSLLAAFILGVTRPTFIVALWLRWRLFLAALLSAGGLAFYSAYTFGPDALVPSGGRVALPFVAYAEQLSVWGALLAVAAVGTFVVGVRARDWSWVLAGLFVLCFGSDVLRDPVNAWRAAGFLPVVWAFGPANMPAREGFRWRSRPKVPASG
jgi:hypothetical protein